MPGQTTGAQDGPAKVEDAAGRAIGSRREETAPRRVGVS
jgi:hypothetical protein